MPNIQKAQRELVNPELEILTFQSVDTDAETPFKASWNIKQTTDNILNYTAQEGLLNSKILTILNWFWIWINDALKCISLIENIWKVLISKIEEKSADFILLKSHNTEVWLKRLFKKDKEIIVLFEKVQAMLSIVKPDLLLEKIISTYIEQWKLNIKNNKKDFLEKLSTSQKINIWWDARYNNIATLSVEELSEIFSYAKNIPEIDSSSYNLDLLNNNQLEAIFSNFTKAKIVSLNGSFSTIWSDKQEIIFKNLHSCETLNFIENNVTDETINLIAKYLTNIKTIDFTMCGLTEVQKENIKNKLPNVEFCFDEEEDINY